MTTQLKASDFSSTFFAKYGSTTLTGISYQSGSTASTAGGQTITLTGTNFISGSLVYITGTVVSVSSVVSPTSITFVSPAKSAGTYVLNVVSPTGGISTLVPGIQYAA